MVSRPRSWSDTRLAVASLIDGTPQIIDLLTDAQPLDTRTVIRLIGDFYFMYSPNSTVVDSLSIVDVGIGVASVEAVGVAVGAGLPDPKDTTNFPPRGWLYVNSQPVSQQAESTGVLNTWAHFKFDLKAARKIDKGTLFFRMENTNIIVGGSMRVIGRIRSLCLG